MELSNFETKSIKFGIFCAKKNILGLPLRETNWSKKLGDCIYSNFFKIAELIFFC